MAPSLRGKLLRWLLVPLGILWLGDAVGTYLTTQRSVNSAADRSLYAAVLSISERVTVAGGQPVVDIPPMALEVLDTDSQERIFYKVSYQVGDGPVTYLTGYDDLPAPPEDEEEQALAVNPADDQAATAPAEPAMVVARLRPPSQIPTFVDSVFHGYPIRIGTLRTGFATAPPIEVQVQVAETLGGRSAQMRETVFREMSVQAVAILLAVGSVWLAVSRGVRPLGKLSAEVTRRSPTDLTPLEPAEVPREVVPVVAAVNGLMVRLRETLAAQGRFIADASHALRTPLAVLRSEADLALRLEDPAALRRAVETLRDHVVSTTHLASQLLTLARVGRRSEQPAEWFDLAAAARDACARLVPSALEHGADLGYAGEAAVPALGIEQDLREVIGNLVDNALRHGPRGAVVTVSVGRDGSDAVLAVEDDGPGIPLEERERVLEPFYRRPGSHGNGSGLGLAIVKEIAGGHGASLRLLAGEGGRGLRVELRLPSRS